MQSNEPGSAAAGIESSRRGAANQGPLGVALTIGGSMLFAAGAVWITGLALDEFGRLGSAVLWGLGALAGSVSRRLTRGPSRLAGWCLVAACVVALVGGETCWLRWNVKQATSWIEAVRLLPRFVSEYAMDVLVAAVFTGFGAESAFRRAAARYRTVQIPVE